MCVRLWSLSGVALTPSRVLGAGFIIQLFFTACSMDQKPVNLRPDAVGGGGSAERFS